MARQHLWRWLLGIAIAVALAFGGLLSNSTPTTVYGADPTPTPATTNGDPGGSSGGGH